MILIYFSITIVYVFLILSLYIGFDRVAIFKPSEIRATTKFSILIPFRNEAAALNGLLNSLNALKYLKSHFEILLVNDDSTDDSVEIIKDFKADHPKLRITLLKNERHTDAPKKDAITIAVKVAKHDWLITTDADCEFPENWLKTISDFIAHQSPKMIVAPVSYHNNKSVLQAFQALDVLSLQSTTIGGFGLKKPFLCNGANLIYQKELFLSLNGFEGNTNIASGDDVFLMEKALAKYPEQVGYLKSIDALVMTQPQPDFNSLLNQRMRWAGKTSAYKNWFAKIVGGIVLLMNATLIITLCLVFIGTLNGFVFCSLFVMKFIIDFILIRKSAVFFKQQFYLKTYALSSILYPFFSVLVVAASVFLSYKWKGRSFKK